METRRGPGGERDRRGTTNRRREEGGKQEMRHLEPTGRQNSLAERQLTQMTFTLTLWSSTSQSRCCSVWLWQSWTRLAADDRGGITVEAVV